MDKKLRKWSLLVTLGIIMLNTSADYIDNTKLSLKKIEESNTLHSFIAYIREGDRSEIVNFGRANLKSSDHFQIGSLSKGHTGYLVAQILAENNIDLMTNAKDYIDNLSADVGQITIKELLTHTSGLPANPPKKDLHQRENPFKEFNREQFDDFLSNLKLDSKDFRYSNIGPVILSLIIERITGKSFKQNLEESFLKINLKNTSLSKSNIIQGYTSWFSEVSIWDTNIFAPSGGISSNLDDQIIFSDYLLSQPDHTIFNPLLDIGEFEMTYLWGSINNGSIISHAGQTSGQSSFFAIDKNKNRALIVLSNTGADLNYLFNLIEEKEVRIPTDFIIKRLYKKLL